MADTDSPPPTPSPLLPTLPLWQSLVLVHAASALSWLAFPKVHWWWCAPLAVACFLRAVAGQRQRIAIGLGILYCLTFISVHIWWAAAMSGPWPWVGLTATQVPMYALLGWGCAQATMHRRPGVLIAQVAAWWIVVEALRARLPWGGFGWARWGFAMGESPLGWFAWLGSTPGVAAVVAVCGAALALLTARKAIPWAAATLAVSLVGGYALGAFASSSRSPAGTLTIASVQGKTARLGLPQPQDRGKVLANHLAETAKLAADIQSGQLTQPDLVVWPEASSDYSPTDDPRVAKEIGKAAADIGAPIMLGTTTTTGDQTFNSLVTVQPGGEITDVYHKRHPVPFGEYIPWRSFFRLLGPLVDQVATDFSGGDRVGVSPDRGGQLICFEVSDDDLVADTVKSGARFLIVPTNNSWFGTTAHSWQHAAMSQQRAMEHGRTVVHVSTVGVSAVFDTHGTPHQWIGHNVAAHTVSSVSLYTQRSPSLIVRIPLELAASLGCVWPFLLRFNRTRRR